MLSAFKIIGKKESGIKDCGSANFDTLAEEPHSLLTEEEKASLNCIEEAYLNCSPAKFKFFVKDPATKKEAYMPYEIIGKENGNCLISENYNPEDPFDESAKHKICKIPMDSIDSILHFMEGGKPTDYFFHLIPAYVFMFEGDANIERSPDSIPF